MFTNFSLYGTIKYKYKIGDLFAIFTDGFRYKLRISENSTVGMKVYAINVKTVEAFPSEYFLKHMPRRYERSKGFLRREDALLSLGAGILIKEVMGIEESAIKYREHGKPYADGFKEFNLSHGGSYAVIVCDGKAVGIDVEPINEANLSIADSVLTEDELSFMREDPLLRFHVLWTAKESLLKAAGLGMTLAPSSFSVLPLELPKRIGDKDLYTRWICFEDCVLSVASEREIREPRLEEIFRKDVEYF